MVEDILFITTMLVVLIGVVGALVHLIKRGLDNKEIHQTFVLPVNIKKAPKVGKVKRSEIKKVVKAVTKKKKK